MTASMFTLPALGETRKVIIGVCFERVVIIR